MNSDPLDQITVDDVLRGGACREGVADWYRENGESRTALPVELFEGLPGQDWLYRAAGRDGGGFGGGNGNGNGNGDGDGFGDGFGFGDGDGDGFGGYGYGDGDGDGGGSGGISP